MKYLIRSIKYFVYFALLTTILIYILVLIGAVEGNIETIFEDGYNSLWKIAVFFAIVAAFYPMLAFIKRDIPTSGDFAEKKDIIIKFMKDRGYELEHSDNTSLSFRIRGTVGKLSKMYEDRIIISASLGGLVMDGLRKDVLRHAAGLAIRLEAQED
jgi:hypothetical protein